MRESIPVSPEELKFYTLKNDLGTEIRILNLGATVRNLYVKDKNGKRTDVLVGPKKTEEMLSPVYIKEDRCFGASVGRYAGRISYGQFNLNGNTYQLYEKDGVHLHGGLRGFQHKLWKLESMDEEENSITLSYLSMDMEEGYPGNLKVQVKYSLTEDDEFLVEYSAVTDKDTPVNLTNHNYYNLNGNGDIKDNELYIASKKILEVDEKQRPTGNFVSLVDHQKDFFLPKTIGSVEVDDTFVLEKEEPAAARLYSPQTGIEMEVRTNQPAVVVFIPETLPQKWEYKSQLSAFPSICIETLNFPDAPNHKNFPSSILKEGEEYKNRSVFKFSHR